MNKILLKLVASGVALALAAILVLMTSYAWFTLSTSPEVGGIQVNISDNTILVAPDLTETEDGKTFHYPGTFSDTLNFSIEESYGYLRSLTGLTPVSTADGIHWFLPAGEDTTGKKVYEVLRSDGQTGRFLMDSTLQYGNLELDQSIQPEGSYIYLDFWVVAPDADYTLRVSTSEDEGGSFLVELPQATRDVTGSYTMNSSSGIASAVARVGFLANGEMVEDQSMLYYQRSRTFNNRYKSLRGNYQERGEAADPERRYRFSIYEPNGDFHPGDDTLLDGYFTTRPVGLADGIPAEVSVQNQTAVQLHTKWLADDNGRYIDQMFQTYLTGKDVSAMEPEEVSRDFYRSFQGQLSAYVSKGEFIRSSAQLTDLSREQLDLLNTEGFTGAAEDVYIINLEQNIPQRIRMFIWMEGQDVDCIQNTSAIDFVLNLELAGSNQK